MTSLADLHVLIVDDNEQMRFLLRCLLRAGGVCNISEAETVGEAFEILRASPVNLVLVDWKMQPTDGLAFTRMTRWDADSPNPYVPILMLTAHTEASRVTAARDAGVTGFVKKPISARVLFERMASALTDTRVFVRTADFFGPDRRHTEARDYAGPFRRNGDRGAVSMVDIDDAPASQARRA